MQKMQNCVKVSFPWVMKMELTAQIPVTSATTVEELQKKVYDIFWKAWEEGLAPQRRSSHIPQTMPHGRFQDVQLSYEVEPLGTGKQWRVIENDEDLQEALQKERPGVEARFIHPSVRSLKEGLV